MFDYCNALMNMSRTSLKPTTTIVFSILVNAAAPSLFALEPELGSPQALVFWPHCRLTPLLMIEQLDFKNGNLY